MSRRKPMTIDELAAAVVALEPGDDTELKRVRRSLSAHSNGKSTPAREKLLSGEACEIIDQVLSGNSDGEGLLADLRQVVASMQKGEDDVERPADSPDSPEKTDDSPDRAVATGDAPKMSSMLEADPELLSEFTYESLEHLKNAENAILQLEKGDEDPESINLVFRAFHTIKGTAHFLGLENIARLAHQAEYFLDRARKGEIQLADEHADLALKAADTLKDMINEIEDDPVQDFNLAPPAGYEELLVKLEISSADAAEDSVEPPEPPGEDELIAGESGVASAKKSDARVIDKARARQKMAGSEVDSTVRVRTERLDGLINMVGELVISSAMIAQSDKITSVDDDGLSRNVSQLNKITRELQDLSMSLRMVPLRSTFQRMSRFVRDMARQSEKKVVLQIEGEDTEIDRNMVESLYDPLVHMIRNAMDHGIELPAERKKKGKPEEGKLILRAYHEAGNVLIELVDDGKGLDREALLEKAESMDLVPSDRELTDGEIHRLIFMPGFSTAKKVTDVSGRGVGMDVVKKNIENMRGRVEVSSTRGEGCKFTMAIPLTLAIIEGMMLKVGPENYIVPTLSVDKAIRPTPEMISTVKKQGEVLSYRDELIPMFRLYRFFKVKGAKEDPTDALLLIVEYENHRIALLADDLLGQQQVVIKSLGDGIGQIDGVSGAAILGDGHVGLILDIPSLIRAIRGRYSLMDVA